MISKIERRPELHRELPGIEASRKEQVMPMIDVYAAAGTFADRHKLAQDLAKAVMKWENIPPINLFKKNTAAFIHELASEAISNAAGGSNYVRVQVLTPINVLNRESNSTWFAN
jgi:hypothetical protein